MLSIYEKEGIINNAILQLTLLKEDLRTKHSKSYYESNIPIISMQLNKIVASDIQDHRIIDIFEGLPAWKDKEYINEFYNDTVNLIV